MYDYERDNEAFFLAKKEMFPDDAMSDLTLKQFSDLIQRAQQIKNALRGNNS